MSSPHAQDLRHTDPRMLKPNYVPPLTPRQGWNLVGAVALAAGAAWALYDMYRHSQEKVSLEKAFAAAVSADVKPGAVIPFDPMHGLGAAEFKISTVTRVIKVTDKGTSVVSICADGDATGSALLHDRTAVRVCKHD